MILSSRKKYLQVALNAHLNDAADIIYQLPQSDRIIVEAGTPLIKNYGYEAISYIYQSWSRRLAGTNILPYVVADFKTMDRAETEVVIAKNAGASAAVALGQAPLETINRFIAVCAEQGIDSMLDMMNVDAPVKILRRLRKQPDVVVLHRGVDEEAFNPDKPIPYIQINKIRSSYSTMIAIAGGDTLREVQRAIFNDANIVIVWKEFYSSNRNVGKLAEEFLREIK